MIGILAICATKSRTPWQARPRGPSGLRPSSVRAASGVCPGPVRVPPGARRRRAPVARRGRGGCGGPAGGGKGAVRGECGRGGRPVGAVRRLAGVAHPLARAPVIAAGIASRSAAAISSRGETGGETARVRRYRIAGRRFPAGGDLPPTRTPARIPGPVPLSGPPLRRPRPGPSASRAPGGPGPARPPVPRTPGAGRDSRCPSGPAPAPCGRGPRPPVPAAEFPGPNSPEFRTGAKGPAGICRKPRTVGPGALSDGAW